MHKKKTFESKTDQHEPAQNEHAPNASQAKLIEVTLTPTSPFLTKIKKMPEITNPNTKLQIQKFGDYKFTKEVGEYKDLPYLGPYELENNAVYYGQWKHGLKHGKGKQVFLLGN
jgi:hypothetical protein